MDGSQEVSGKFVVASCDTPKILEAAETALDNVAPLIGAFAEAVEGDPIGFVWNDGLGTAINDFSAKVVAVVSFVADEGRHGWRELQKDRRCGNICILAWSEMKCARSAIRVTQRVDFCGPPTARAADRLFMLPPFPPLAERYALIEVESMDKVRLSLPQRASASKIACQCPRLAQRLKRCRSSCKDHNRADNRASERRTEACE